ncbi:histidine utilization repressor [Burkholderiaceae bacterium DAT-1]|nr:histidine utilization repressor [Burkholderiaceae bacterium DAT-1]
MSMPAYLEIKRYVLEEIESGRLRAGDLVPSENELARRFDVARMTVNRAIRELAAEGVLTRTQGSGTYVSATKHASTLVEIRSIADEIRARGNDHEAQVLSLGEVKADAVIAREMQVEERTKVFHSVILHLENGQPIQLEERWVRPDVAPDYLAQNFARLTPNEYLVRVAPLSAAEYRIEARMPDRVIRARLQMDKNEPCLILSRRTFSAGKVATVAVLYHPAQRYQFAGSM